MQPLAHTADWHEARRLAGDAAATLPSETISLAEAVGRVLAVPLRAKIDVPHYRSSAMDGWAIRGAGPWALIEATAEVAQQTAVAALPDGFAVAAVTGGTIPDGTDAVLRSESGMIATAGGAQMLTSTSITGEPWPGQHIRQQGAEALRGDTVIEAATVLNPAHIAVAAVCGFDVLDVVSLPRIAVLLTGDEVVTAGIPLAGQVRDSFGPQLPQLLTMLGGQVISQQRVRDELGATIEALGQAADMIVTTGGTGDSAVDHLRPALTELDATFIVERVAMRPGGPTFLARLPDGRLVVGLPGNPLAAMMGVLTVVEPLIAALGGRRARETGLVTMGEAAEGRRATSILMPYRLVDGCAVANQWTGSGMMRGLADAAGILVVPAEGAEAGQQAEMMPLPWAAC